MPVETGANFAGGDRDLETGTCERVLEGHTGWVTSVALHADERRAVSASEDGTLRVWDLATGTCERVVDMGRVMSVAVGTDGRRALSASDDRTIRLWDLDTGALVARWDGDHAATACACAASGAIVIGDASGAVLFLELVEAAHARA